MKINGRFDRKSVRTSILNEWIDYEMSRCKVFHYKFTRRLNRLADTPVSNVLRYTKKNGEMYYSEMWLEDGKRKSRYLGKEDSEDVMRAKERRFLEAALSELEKHKSQLATCASFFKRFEPAEVNDKLPKAYRLSGKALETISGPNEEDKWYLEAMRIKELSEKGLSDYFKYGRKHTAKDGTKVRSKSELQIANALFDRGIKYIYELPLTIRNVPIHPDFTFYSYSRGKVMYWEHAGMLGDEEYRAEFADRVSMYIKGNLVPCVDVIFTFDTADGSLDAGMIEAVIDEFM